MKICLLADGTPKPVLAAVMDALAQHHEVSVWSPAAAEASGSPWHPGPRADVYLLKSRTPQARALAHSAEWEGAVVLNSPAATSAALDRHVMTERLALAGVPAPRTWSFPSLAALAREVAAEVPVAVPAEQQAGQPGPAWPLVVKSRTSARGDLVTLVRGGDDLARLMPEWADEPVIAQEFVDSDGFDIKVWVIGDDLSAARRPGALEVCDKTSDVALAADDIPDEWRRVAMAAGAALGLSLFGVDLLITAGGPVVIDVNAFPGFRGAHDPALSLLRLLETHTTEGLVTR
jgi:ribosomal protein S6--L-glutamate ligase